MGTVLHGVHQKQFNAGLWKLAAATAPIPALGSHNKARTAAAFFNLLYLLARLSVLLLSRSWLCCGAGEQRMQLPKPWIPGRFCNRSWLLLFSLSHLLLFLNEFTPSPLCRDPATTPLTCAASPPRPVVFPAPRAGVSQMSRAAAGAEVLAAEAAERCAAPALP